MGQARQRGSFEVRKEQSIERQKREGEEAYRAYKEAEAKMTPVQKKERLRVATVMASIAPFMGATK